MAAGSALAGPGSFGRLSGLVSDRQGNPLTGASVLIVGPGITRRVERVLTDAHGRFTADHLVPGRYSLRVAATNQLPVSKSGIEVQPGQTSELSLILGEILPALRPVPGHTVVRSGDDWKWVLRTSGAVRPALRYGAAAGSQAPLEPSQTLIAMIPGSAREDALGDDSGFGSMLAYWRPLSADADLLVAGSMVADGLAASSLVTSFRRNAVDGNPQELTLVVHELSFSEGVQIPAAEGPGNLASAQGVTVSYAQTRRISDALEFTSGFEINYLNASRDAVSARPRAGLQYRLSPASKITVRYGAIAPVSDDTLAGKLDELNAFPYVSLRSYAPRLETARHSEVAYSRQLTKSTELEVAAYHDGFTDAVVRGFGQPDAWSRWGQAGNALPNDAANGVNLNAGNYGSSGARASVSQRLGRHVEAAVLYATGDALTAVPAAVSAAAAEGDFASVVHPRRSESASGRITAQIPVTKTQVVASYAWVEPGSVTAVDPYGLADLDIAPYLGLQLRQPLPTLAFLPGAHIEALADFRNLTGEGYVRLANDGGDPLILTPAYRSFRGGFSVQF